VVAEKTGYPADMLDLGMALDTDLGIDSIKRVEILSALQERLPEAPQVGPEHLGTLHTLREVANFLTGAAANAPPHPVHRNGSADRSPSVPAASRIAEVLVEVVAEKTGYPADMLDLGMALDTDLGIDSIKRVEILSALQERLPEAPVVGPEHLGTLHTLREVADFLAGSGDLARRSPEQIEQPAPLPGPLAGRRPAPPGGGQLSLHRTVLCTTSLQDTEPRPPVPLARDSEIWLTGDDRPLAAALAACLVEQGFRVTVLPCAAFRDQPAPAALGGLIVLAPRAAVEDAFLRDALLMVRQAASALRAAGRHRGAVLLTVAHLDGRFGLGTLDPDRVPLDGGLAGLVKTAAREWPEVACKAIDLGRDLPSVESAAAAIVEELLLDGPIEVGLSPAGRCTLELRPGTDAEEDRTPLFAPGDVILLSGGARGVTAEAAIALAEAFRPTLVLLGRSAEPQPEPDWLTPLTSEAEIKRALVLQANGNASLKLVGEQYRELTAAREIRRTLQRVAAAGGRGLYRQVDVRDAAVVGEIVAAIHRDVGPVRGLVHGAGVLADARIEDKTEEQFDRVWQTKVAGLSNLLAALPGDELRALVLFSSSTARFGRVGQVDYAIANEALNKLAQREARRRPGCRVVAVNWGPWDGGMVTSGLKKVFESEKVGLIPPEQGGRFLVQELQRRGGEVEVVVLAPEPLEEVSSAPARSLPVAFERVLDRAGHPVLESHQLGGRPVVPVALLMEWMAHAALHCNPGLLFHGCDNLRVFRGIILDCNPPETILFAAGKAHKRDGLLVAPVEVRGRQADGRDVLHARADVILAAALPSPPSAGEPPAASRYERPVAEVYRELLFHGSRLHGLRRIDALGPAGIIAECDAAPPPSAWLARPLRQKWLLDPLVLDASFQIMVVWTLEQRGAGSLPTAIGEYRQYRRSFPAEGARLLVRVRRTTPGGAVADIDYLDASGAVIARLQGYEAVIDAGLQRAFRPAMPSAAGS
jgi:NAD(P)-dependent dehydrogenase (short-subunit alcohol dehydrogenase family)/acyl carrier protein